MPRHAGEQYLHWRLGVAASGKPSDTTVKLKDGRTFLIHHEPMPDGGWVATHQDISQRCESEARIAHMALHDALTGLANRTLLNQRLDAALAEARRGRTFALHLLDLDRFKFVNDTLGHPVGDKLLNIVAERLRLLVRDTDVIARMGGDEFAIIQSDIRDAADASILAARVIAALGTPYEIDGVPVEIGASIGIALVPQDGDSAEQLLRNVDMALYSAKDNGRSTFCYFDCEMDARLKQRHALEQDIKRALDAREFEPFYQPIVNAANGRIEAFEALARWRHPAKGLLSPDAFIAVAEETGMIVALGAQILEKACIAAVRWPSNIKVAVNLAPAQFRSRHIVQTIKDTLTRSGLEPSRLEVEVNEMVFARDAEATIAVLEELKILGVKIAMDDFGIGYSSLTYLHRMKFDTIKIDRSFIHNITDSKASLSVVRAVIALARTLDVTTTVEGVETVEQLEILRAEGCTSAQGYLFGRPGAEPSHEPKFVVAGRRERTQSLAVA